MKVMAGQVFAKKMQTKWRKSALDKFAEQVDIDSYKAVFSLDSS